MAKSQELMNFAVETLAKRAVNAAFRKLLAETPVGSRIRCLSPAQVAEYKLVFLAGFGGGMEFGMDVLTPESSHKRRRR